MIAGPTHPSIAAFAATLCAAASTPTAVAAGAPAAVDANAPECTVESPADDIVTLGLRAEVPTKRAVTITMGIDRGASLGITQFRRRCIAAKTLAPEKKLSGAETDAKNENGWVPGSKTFCVPPGLWPVAKASKGTSCATGDVSLI